MKSKNKQTTKLVAIQILYILIYNNIHGNINQFSNNVVVYKIYIHFLNIFELFLK